MSLLWAVAAVVLCLVGNTGDSVASVLWTASDLSLYGLLLVMLAGLGASFFLLLAGAAVWRRDFRVLLPHSSRAQRRLFCLGVLCPRAHRDGLWGGGASSSKAVDADIAGDEDVDIAATGGAAVGFDWLASLTQTELMVGPMGAINTLSVVLQWYATPPQRTPPLLQALLPVAMILASPPLSRYLLRDRKVYCSAVPLLALGLIAASVVVSVVPSIQDAAAGLSVGSESSIDTVLWSLVYTLSMVLSAAAFVLQQLYLIRAGALLPHATQRHSGLAIMRNLAYNQLIVTMYVGALFWIDVLPWWGSTASLADLSDGVSAAVACSISGKPGSGFGPSGYCDPSTPIYSGSYLVFEVIYLVGAMMVSKDSAVFSALLSVAMTALLDIVWLSVPSLNPAPSASTPLWSVLASFGLSACGIVILKLWEASTPVELQFDLGALECEERLVLSDSAKAQAVNDLHLKRCLADENGDISSRLIRGVQGVQ